LEVLREVLPVFDWAGISLCPFLPRFDVLLLAYFAGGLIGVGGVVPSTVSFPILAKM
jgi:hypothetical protein